MEGADASQVIPDEQVSAVFTTKLTSEEYILDDDSTGPFILPASSTRTELCSLLSQLLNLKSAKSSSSFDFIVNGSPLRLSLKQHLDVTQHTSEHQITIEYFLAWTPSEPKLVAKSPSAVLQLQQLGRTGKILSLCTRGTLCWKEFGTSADTPQDTIKVESDVCIYMYHQSDITDESADFLVFTSAGTIYKVNLAKQISYRVAKLNKNETPSKVVLKNNECFATASASGTVSIYKTNIRETLLNAGDIQPKRKLGAQQPKINTLEPAFIRKDVHASEISGVELIHLCDDVEILVSGGIDGFVRMLDCQSGNRIGEFNAKEAISSIIARKGPLNDHENNSLDAVGIQIVTGHTSGQVRLWTGTLQRNVSTNKETHATPSHFRLGQMELTGSFPAHNKFVTACCWNQFNADVIATASNDQRVSVIDLRTRQIPLSLTIIPDSSKICPSLEQREYTTVPTALLWWDERVLVVGTSQNTILQYTY